MASVFQLRGAGLATVTAAVVLIMSVAQIAPAAEKAAPKNDPKLGVVDLSKLIDKEVGARLAEEKISISAKADDAEFVRRVYLDITGVIPPADKAAEFIDSKEANKRAKLIDELLESPAYGRHMADIWAGMMIPRDSDNRRLSTETLVKWLDESFNANKPWNKFVHELLTASGPFDENGAVTYFLANNSVDKVTDSVGKLFMGVQIQCAQCHNHPFTAWKQNDYWGMAGFFMKVRANGNPRNAAKNGTTLAISEENGPRGRRQNLPESAKMLPPKFLGADEPKVKKDEPYRPVFADWLTTAENPFFAKAIVNRTWAQYFGRGIVHPIDDMHANNKASHPELLDQLAEQFSANGFDLKYLVRAICNSETYQRTSKPTADNETDYKFFSHMAIKSLSPEQLFDSIVAVVGQPKGGAPDRRPAMRGGPVGARAQFVAFFETDENADPTDYHAGIPQALRLMNSPQLSNGAALLTEIGKAKPKEAIEKMFLSTLSRRPTEKELDRFTAHVTKTNDVKKAYSDILWALLNSSEFALNH